MRTPSEIKTTLPASAEVMAAAKMVTVMVGNKNTCVSSFNSFHRSIRPN